MLEGPSRRLALLVTLVAAACGGSRPGPSRTLLRAAVRADVTGFFPNRPAANESYTFEMNRWVLDALVGLDRGLNVVPALAAHWLTPDDRTFVLELRPGLRFSDGRAVTAADAARSLEAGKQLAWPNDGYLSTVESVRVLDERRLEVRAARPDPTLLARLAWGFVLPGRRDGRAAGARGRDGPLHAREAGPRANASSSPATRTTGARLRPSSGPSFAWCPTTRRACASSRPARPTSRTSYPRTRGRGSRSSRTSGSSWARACGCCSSACASTVPRSTTRACARRSTWRSIERRSSSGCSSAREPWPISSCREARSATSPSCPRRRTIPSGRERCSRAAGLGPGHRLRLDGPSNRYVQGRPAAARGGAAAGGRRPRASK